MKGKALLTFYPSNVHVVNELRRLCGHHFGIAESQIVQVTQVAGAPRLQTMTARLPDYHKLLLGDKAEIQYHLSGYGVYREEALIRLLGESIERYALITAATTLRNKLFKASYNELKSDPGVLPWELINTFSERDYERMRGKMIFRPITPDDPISWIWCPSLVEPGKEICIPAQCLFTGLHAHDEIPFITSFSKGCASHTTRKLALRSAIMEAVEADALMARWYALVKARRVVLDDPVLQGLIAEIFHEVNVDVVPYEYTMPGMPGHVFAVALLSEGRERPSVLLGTGAGLLPGATLYRTLIEAVAIHYIGYNGPVLQPRDYLSGIAEDSHTNLDSNVAYWASSEDGDRKRAFLRGMVDGEVRLSALPSYESTIDGELAYIVGRLKDVSRYAVHLDITPPELAGTDWSVARVFIPELVQVSLPSFPYSAHPRLRGFGGVRNELPHPSP
ncbi:YcaO-like family protein [Actinoplanes sp. NPDC049265]|uniref:YcaO-like family protein n=1 Tax=Actinoplanes sp. NPDC049265 TaxID=3363902 RepID=UPI003719DC2E